MAKGGNDIKTLADEEVMHLVQEGDPRAFELLFDRHGGAAFALAYRMLGDRVGAEDVSQEAFLSIWRSRLRYQPDRGSVRTWVLGIVHNRAIDGLRRNLVHDKRRASAEGIEERFEAPEQTDVEVARMDEARIVRGAIEELPDEQSVGAYLLGALDETETRNFEDHLEECPVCREEVERLRPAVDALARSVPP